MQSLRNERNRRRRGILLWALALSLVGACARTPDPGTAGAAYVGVVKALQDGDAAALYAYLPDSMRDDLAALYEELQATVADIKRSYPASDRAGALAAAGVELVKGVDGPAGMFAKVFLGPRAGAEGFLARFGAGIRGTDEKGGRARVTTMAGDVHELRRASDGTWRWTPPERDRDLVRAALEKARANRTRVRTAIRDLGRFRGTGVVEALPPPANDVAPAEKDNGRDVTEPAAGDAQEAGE